MASTILTILGALLAATAVNAESHTISFDNKCGKGTPQLLLGGKVVSTGQPYTSNGPFESAIAYLQTGECDFNGEKCTLMEMTLGNPNPSVPGSGSSTDISLIEPHAFNVAASFSYQNGCDGLGAACNDAKCNTAFFKPDDNQVQVQCQANNVNLVITFCGDSTSAAAPASKQTQSSNPSPPATKSVAAPEKAASPAASVKPTAALAAAPAPSSAPASSKGPSRKSCAPKRRSVNQTREKFPSSRQLMNAREGTPVNARALRSHRRHRQL